MSNTDDSKVCVDLAHRVLERWLDNKGNEETGVVVSSLITESREAFFRIRSRYPSINPAIIKQGIYDYVRGKSRSRIDLANGDDNIIIKPLIKGVSF